MEGTVAVFDGLNEGHRGGVHVRLSPDLISWGVAPVRASFPNRFLGRGRFADEPVCLAAQGIADHQQLRRRQSQ